MGWNESAWYAFFLGVALKGTAVLAAALLAAFLLRRRSAAARHLVWTAAAAAILALPLCSVALPALRLPAPLRFLAPNVVFRTAAPASAVAAAAAPSRLPEGAPALTGSAARPVDWRLWVMLLWVAGVAAAAAQMLVACAALWRVRRAAKPFVEPDLTMLAGTLGIRHHVEVLQSRPGSMPMTFGPLRPAVFMPADAAGWSEDRRRMVLLHELAHVRRGDIGTHLLARSALSLYWWNPLAWTAWRQFLKERERATDDLVLRAGARASEYASHLLEVARTMQTAPALGWAAVAMARRSQLEGRLLAILDPGVNRNAPGRISALIAAVLAVCVVAPFAALQAQDSMRTAVEADVDATIRAATSQKNHEMLEQAASVFEKLRQFDTAQKLLESAAAIRAEVSGEQSVAYGIGLLKLGDLEQKRQLTESAGAFYGKAAQVLGERPEAAKALLHLGAAAIVRKDYTHAIEFLQHAQRVDPAHAGPALMWMAVVRDREQNPEEAETLFRSALAAADERSLEASTALTVFAQFLRQQGRAAEAAGLDSQAAAIRKANGAPITAASPSSGVYRVGGGVTAPRLVYKVEPQYSEEARAARLHGTVTVYLEIGPEGLAHNMQVVSGQGLGLDEKALQAIALWKFSPGTKDGVPVPVAALIEVNFRLM